MSYFIFDYLFSFAYFSDTLINISSVIKASIDSSQVDVKFSKNLFESFYATFLQTRCDHLPYLPCASNVNINTTIFSVNGECFSLTKDVIPTCVKKRMKHIVAILVVLLIF